MIKRIIRILLASSLAMALIITGGCSTTSIRYELKTSVEPAGAGTVSPGGTYDSGSNVRITATPGEGYVFDGWSGDVSGYNSEQTVVMNGDKNVTAHFKSKESESEPVEETSPEPVYYTLTARAEPATGGSVNPADGMFKGGTTLTLVATPEAGYAVSGWSGDVSGISESVVVTMDSDKNITVHFEVTSGQQVEPKQYLLTTSVDPAGSGVVDPSGGKINVHAKLTLTAMAADGYVFHHWGGDVSGTSDTVSFNMDGDMSVTAFFEEAGELTITSPAFAAEGNIPSLYTCSGDDISPELSWKSVPFGTESFVLIVDDPDAPQGTFTHWIIYNIPAESRMLQANIPVQAELSDGSLQGINNFATHGYGGPCPPQGEKHEYRFVLYAIDTVIELSPYAATKSAVLAAINGHILEQARISGYYLR